MNEEVREVIGVEHLKTVLSTLTLKILLNMLIKNGILVKEQDILF